MLVRTQVVGGELTTALSSALADQHAVLVDQRVPRALGVAGWPVGVVDWLDVVPTLWGVGMGQ